MATPTFEALQNEALNLPPAERGALAQRLFDSLDADEGYEQAWAEELDRREAAIADGSAQWVPFEDAMARARHVAEQAARERVTSVGQSSE